MRIEFDEDSLCVTVRLHCPFRPGVGLFFYEMVTKWLVPNLILEPQKFLVEREGEQTSAMLKVCLPTEGDKAIAEKNFPFLQREIEIGARSFYHATKILEMKGLSDENKVALVQQKLSSAIARFPDVFDFDLYATFHKLLVAAKSGYVKTMSPSHFSKLTKALYRFEKRLEGGPKSKRSLFLRFQTRHLITPLGVKEVIGICGGLSFVNENEVFEERHLLSAIEQVCPDAHRIPDSFYSFEVDDGIMFTIEIESGELNALQRDLPLEIRARIEHLVPPVFMPRNEEEVMRNILTLSNEIASLQDIPQVTISFDEQSANELSFTVILVRPLLEESRSIPSLFPGVTIERVRKIGAAKESAVLRFQLPSEDFLREDYSVDLFAARGRVVKKLEAILGEVRDFNGGMIAKQREQFSKLQALLGPLTNKRAFLLQNFFHSLTPATWAATLPPEKLKRFFLLFLEAIEDPMECANFQEGDGEALYTIAKGERVVVEEGLALELRVFDTLYTGVLTFAENRSYS